MACSVCLVSRRLQGIGFGAQTMAATEDFVICVVESEISAVCTDHSGPGE